VGVGGAGAQWGDVFTYDERSNLTSRTDARGVKTVYSYNNDPLNRLQSVSWDTSGFGDTANPIVASATVTYQYRQKSTGSELKDITQLATVTTTGVSTESYSYDSEGRIGSKTLTLTSRAGFSFVTNYSYDSLDRLTDLLYPKQYGNGTQEPRKTVHHDYEIAGRLSALTYDGQSFASNILYNPNSQTSSLLVGTGANQIAESYTYNAQNGLLDNQTVARGATTLLDLSYDYANPNANGKRTGQLTKILNNLNHNKDRGYSYDALGRLVQANGGVNGALWTQTYVYDRYGNRTSVSASGNSAKLSTSRDSQLAQDHSATRNPHPRMAQTSEPGAIATGSITQPGDPKVELPTDLLAKNNLELPNESGANQTASGSLSDSPSTLYASGGKRASVPRVPQSGPPIFTDDPLVAGTTVIKAVHITELRTAINSLRQQRGFSVYSWQYSATTNDLISANPISEMRTALDQVLGSPSGGYSADLAQGQPVLAVHIQELRNRVKNNWNASLPIPRDGQAALAYETATNRITTAGFAYDAAGNQVRALIPGGSGSQRFRYDAANRLAQVRTDDNNTIIASYTYGEDNQRLMTEEAGLRTYYVAEGLSVIAEYVEIGSSVSPSWSRSYVYLDARLLSTLTPNGAGGESVEYDHPDRLGTRITTNPANGTWSEQVTLPFGTALGAESTGTPTNRRFTSYDRSTTTGLDYAVNRHYDAQQGRFTQVDPDGLKAMNLDSPQTLNLYAYCVNDPINHTDPSGLGFFSFLKKIFKWVVVIVAVIVAVLTVIYTGQIQAAIGLLKTVLALVANIAAAASQVFNALGLKKLGAIFDIIAAGAAFGFSLRSIAGKGWALAKTILKAVQDGAAFVSKTLTLLAHKKLGQIFDLVSSTAGFISGAIRNKGSWGFHPKKWDIYKFVRSTSEKIANLAGEERVGGFLNVLGLVDDIGDIYYGLRDFGQPGSGAIPLGKVLLRTVGGPGVFEQLLPIYKKINSAFGRIDKAIALAH
jgi:RHS repeat-associated protein